MNRNTRWVGIAAVGGLLLGANPARADVRWPWESDKKEKKEKTEPTTKTTTTRVPRPGATPAPKFTGTAQDQQMLPRLAEYYQRQLDLSDRALDATNPQVRSFAQKLQRESERALGVINEEARSKGLVLEPHVRVAVVDRLRQAGRSRGLGTAPAPAPAPAATTDQEFLSAVLANIQQIRPDFAAYKEQNSDRALGQELGRLFNDELVPGYEEAKALHDRVRNDARK